MPEYLQMLHTLPAHMRSGIKLWIEMGQRSHPGSFLSALLSNDLVNAVGRADEENEAALGRWVRYLYNYAPGGCYGSPEKFAAWQGIGAPAEADAA